MRSVTILFLALLVLGALADTVRRRHAIRRQGPSGPRPGPPPAQPPPHGEGNGNGNGNGNHGPGDGHDHPEGEPIPAKEGPQSLDEAIDQFCDAVSAGCEKDGMVSSSDGTASDLCDNTYCMDFMPHNLCFFDCATKCGDVEECIDGCMDCSQHPPLPPPPSVIPQICDEVAKSCEKEGKVSSNDGTAYDLCDAEHCKTFLPDHMCFFGCTWKCQNEATGDQNQDEACVNDCMTCEGDGEVVEGAGEGEGEGNGEEEGHEEGNGNGEHNGNEGNQNGNAGANEGNHEANEGNHNGNEGNHEEGNEGNHEANAGEEAEEANEVAERLSRLMRRKRTNKSFSRVFNQARSHQTAYRRYSTVQRRAPARRGTYRRSSSRRSSRRYYSNRY